MKLTVKQLDTNEVFFWLEEHDGSIILKAATRSGFNFSLLTVCPNGVRFNEGIDNSLGFPVDTKGRLIRTDI